MKKMSKVQLFKSLIKEAVREVIQEEVRDIIREELEKSGKNILNEEKVIPKRNSYEEFLPGYKQVKAKQQLIQNNIVNSKPKNPIEQLLAETQQNMTSEDFRTHTNVGNVETPTNGFNMSQFTQQIDPNIGEIEEWEPTNVKLPIR